MWVLLRRRMGLFWVCITVLLLFNGLVASRDVYLSPNGDNDDECIITEPCLSFSRAISFASDNTTFYLNAGTYSLNNLNISFRNYSIVGLGAVSVTCSETVGISMQGMSTVKGITFEGCNTAISIVAGAQASLIQNNFKSCNVAINATFASSLSLQFCNITNSFTTYKHAPLFIMGINDVTITGCNFINNFGSNLEQQGSAITFHSANNIIITGSSFINNTSPNGGAITQTSYLSATTSSMIITIIGCNFTRNSNSNNTSHGGAVTLLGGLVSSSFTSSSFYYNSASKNGGGAVYVGPSSTSVFQSCFFFENSARDGGSVFVGENATVIVRGTQFNNNRASNNGGAIATSSSSSLSVLASCEFNSNYAVRNGGGIIASGTFQFKNSKMNYNIADFQGGSLCLQSVYNNSSLSDSLFYHNTGFYGGLFFNSSSLSIQNCEFYNNTAKEEGGGILAVASVAIMTSNTFNNNYSPYGGGIAIERSNVTLLRITSINNRASSLGGVIVVGGSNIHLDTCNISRNTAATGGGAVISFSQGSIIRSSISYNNASLAGGFYLESSLHINDIYYDSGKGEIVGNVGKGGGMYLTGIGETRLRMFSTILSNDSPYKFCCSPSFSSSLSKMTALQCNYPSCSSSCGGGNNGCNCTTIPSLSPPDYFCNCAAGLIGAFCNIYDECSNSSFCGGTYCKNQNYDYSCSNCRPGYVGTGGSNCTYLPAYQQLKTNLSQAKKALITASVIYMVVMAAILIPALIHTPIAVPIAIYMVVVSLMVVLSVLPQYKSPLMTLGCWMYIISDSLIALDRFYMPLPYPLSFLSWPLYYIGQILISIGLLREKGKSNDCFFINNRLLSF